MQVSLVHQQQLKQNAGLNKTNVNILDSNVYRVATKLASSQIVIINNTFTNIPSLVQVQNSGSSYYIDDTNNSVLKYNGSVVSDGVYALKLAGASNNSTWKYASGNPVYLYQVTNGLPSAPVSGTYIDSLSVTTASIPIILNTTGLSIPSTTPSASNTYVYINSSNNVAEVYTPQQSNSSLIYILDTSILPVSSPFIFLVTKTDNTNIANPFNGRCFATDKTHYNNQKQLGILDDGCMLLTYDGTSSVSGDTQKIVTIINSSFYSMPITYDDTLNTS